MAADTSMLHVRVDDHIKEQAIETLAAMGLSVSEAVRPFLRRVVTGEGLIHPDHVQCKNAQVRSPHRARAGDLGGLALRSVETRARWPHNW